MKSLFLLAGAFSLLNATSLLAQATKPEAKMSYLDNGEIRLGIDLSIGGAVTYLSDAQKPNNLINSFDWGRQVQMSFYSGPIPFQPPGTTLAPEWKALGWNPIQSGDHFGHGSPVLEHRNDGKTLFVRCTPMIWPLNNVPAECTFESTYTLKGRTVEVISRLINARSDKTQYAARNQELPAVYTNGPWYKLVSYRGDKPFTGAPPTVIVDKDDGKGWPWRNFYTAEGWTALLNKDDSGLGVFNPHCYRISGGFAGAKGSGGPKDGPTGYASPLAQEILDHNIVYQYRYVLILGTLQEIRDYAYNHTPRNQPLQWSFTSDRQQWTYQNTVDEGWPIRGELRVPFNAEKQAAMLSPVTFWRSEEAPKLSISAAFETDAKEIHIAVEPFSEQEERDWPQWGEGSQPPPKKPLGPLRLPIIGDGVYRDYTLDLSQLAGYQGSMTRLIFLLPGTSGKVKVRTIKFGK